MELSVSDFANSLPAEYQARFNPAQIAAHAHAAVRRLPGQVSARIFPHLELGVTGVCVIAEDRPGLLSLISRALSELGFDIHSAEAYTRQGTPNEAVDLFWINDPEEMIDESQADALATLLQEIISGRPAAPRLQVRDSSALRGEALGTTVRFLENNDGLLTVLEVETDDRSGLLFAITSVLYEQNVQIFGSRVTTRGSRVHDSFSLAELSGAPVGPERRLLIQVAILAAIES